MTSILFLNFRTKYIEPRSKYVAGLYFYLCIKEITKKYQI